MNPKHAHVIGAEAVDWGNAIHIGFVHSEFPEVPDYDLVPVYDAEGARRRFPFLFVETNPLLYRRFK